MKPILFLGCISLGVIYSIQALADGAVIRERPFTNFHKEYDVITNGGSTGTIKEVPFQNKPTYEVFDSSGNKTGTITKKPFTNNDEYEYESEE